LGRATTPGARRGITTEGREAQGQGLFSGATPVTARGALRPRVWVLRDKVSYSSAMSAIPTTVDGAWRQSEVLRGFARRDVDILQAATRRRGSPTVKESWLLILFVVVHTVLLMFMFHKRHSAPSLVAGAPFSPSFDASAASFTNSKSRFVVVFVAHISLGSCMLHLQRIRCMLLHLKR